MRRGYREAATILWQEVPPNYGRCRSHSSKSVSDGEQRRERLGLTMWMCAFRWSYGGFRTGNVKDIEK